MEPADYDPDGPLDLPDGPFDVDENSAPPEDTIDGDGLAAPVDEDGLTDDEFIEQDLGPDGQGNPANAQGVSGVVEDVAGTVEGIEGSSIDALRARGEATKALRLCSVTDTPLNEIAALRVKAGVASPLDEAVADLTKEGAEERP